MKTKQCIVCGNDIPQGRLKAIPDTKTCTGCTTENRYYANQIVANDEEYTELQFIKDPNTISQIRQYKNENTTGSTPELNIEEE